MLKVDDVIFLVLQLESCHIKLSRDLLRTVSAQYNVIDAQRNEKKGARGIGIRDINHDS